MEIHISVVFFLEPLKERFRFPSILEFQVAFPSVALVFARLIPKDPQSALQRKEKWMKTKAVHFSFERILAFFFQDIHNLSLVYP